MALARLIMSDFSAPSPVIMGERLRRFRPSGPTTKRAKVKAARKQRHRK